MNCGTLGVITFGNTASSPIYVTCSYTLSQKTDLLLYVIETTCVHRKHCQHTRIYCFRSLDDPVRSCKCVSCIYDVQKAPSAPHAVEQRTVTVIQQADDEDGRLLSRSRVFSYVVLTAAYCR